MLSVSRCARMAPERNRNVMLRLLELFLALSAAGFTAPETPIYKIPLSVTSPLPFPRTPMDPAIDFGAIIAEAGLPGVLDPNGIAVFDAATGVEVPCAVTEDFAYGNRGRVEWVIDDPEHREYVIRFRTAPARPALEPATFTPLGRRRRFAAVQCRGPAPDCPALFEPLGRRDGRREAGSRRVLELRVPTGVALGRDCGLSPRGRTRGIHVWRLGAVAIRRARRRGPSASLSFDLHAVGPGGPERRRQTRPVVLAAKRRCGPRISQYGRAAAGRVAGIRFERQSETAGGSLGPLPGRGPGQRRGRGHRAGRGAYGPARAYGLSAKHESRRGGPSR